MVINRSKLATCTLLESDHQSFKKTGATSTKIPSALLDVLTKSLKKEIRLRKDPLAKQLFTTKASNTTVEDFFFRVLKFHNYSREIAMDNNRAEQNRRVFTNFYCFEFSLSFS